MDIGDDADHGALAVARAAPQALSERIFVRPEGARQALADHRDGWVLVIGRA